MKNELLNALRSMLVGAKGLIDNESLPSGHPGHEAYLRMIAIPRAEKAIEGAEAQLQGPNAPSADVAQLRAEAKQWIEDHGPSGLFGPCPTRSCWNCNPAHEGLKQADYPLECPDCGHIYFRGVRITETEASEAENAPSATAGKSEKCKECRPKEVSSCVMCINGSDFVPRDRADKNLLYKLVEELISAGFRGSAQSVVDEAIAEYEAAVALADDRIPVLSQASKEQLTAAAFASFFKEPS